MMNYRTDSAKYLLIDSRLIGVRKLDLEQKHTLEDAVKAVNSSVNSRIVVEPFTLKSEFDPKKAVLTVTPVFPKTDLDYEGGLLRFEEDDPAVFAKRYENFQQMLADTPAILSQRYTFGRQVIHRVKAGAPEVSDSL